MATMILPLIIAAQMMLYNTVLERDVITAPIHYTCSTWRQWHTSFIVPIQFMLVCLLGYTVVFFTGIFFIGHFCLFFYTVDWTEIWFDPRVQINIFTMDGSGIPIANHRSTTYGTAHSRFLSLRLWYYSILKGVAGIRIIDNFNITYWEKEWVVLIKAMGVGEMIMEDVGEV